MLATRYILFATKPYSFPALRPIQTAIQNGSNSEAAWFTAGSARHIETPCPLLRTKKSVLQFDPHAIIVPGNVVPYSWPGLKIQIFHGLGEEKKGHYRITGFFDLYCTPGPFMTERFQKLASRHNHFLVRETGWSKLDGLDHDANRRRCKIDLAFDPDRPVLLFAPTFSPKYSSAEELVSAVERLREGPCQWLIKFHDIMDAKTIRKYEKMQGPGLVLWKSHDINPLMEASDLMITDTSSVAYEYLLMDRPIITYKATARQDKGINIDSPDQLGSAIERSLADPKEFSIQRSTYLKQLHPYTDRQSSYRILKAIEETIESGEHLKLNPALQKPQPSSNEIPRKNLDRRR